MNDYGDHWGQDVYARPEVTQYLDTMIDPFDSVNDVGNVVVGNNPFGDPNYRPPPAAVKSEFETTPQHTGPAEPQPVPPPTGEQASDHWIPFWKDGAIDLWPGGATVPPVPPTMNPLDLGVWGKNYGGKPLGNAWKALPIPDVTAPFDWAGDKMMMMMMMMAMKD